MRIIIDFTLLCIVLVSFLANPAPESIELADLILIALPCFLAVICLSATTSYEIYQTESNLLIAIMLYLSYLLGSMLLGLLHGVSLLNVLRSIGPYINFIPLLFMGLLPSRLINPWSIGLILIMIGTLQASYQIYLFLTHSNEAVNTIGILRSRITLIEPRTTLPIALAVAILPMAFLSTKNILVKLMLSGLIILGIFASTATLTRSIMISILIGIITYIFLYIHKQIRSYSFSLLSLLRSISIYMTFFIVSILLMSMIPKIYILEQGLFARFYHYTSSTASADYSNGRLYDEWLPALKTWLSSDILSLFFGIGAGNTFIVPTGEERTYIHNLSIYSLVYGGIYGLFACLWLYYTLFKTLIIRAYQSQQIIYLGFAALLLCIFSYGQFFAVHKGLAFNAMLFLMITIALCKPTKRV